VNGMQYICINITKQILDLSLAVMWRGFKEHECYSFHCLGHQSSHTLIYNEDVKCLRILVSHGPGCKLCVISFLLFRRIDL